MEVMETSLDKFYKKIYSNGDKIPEEVLGKIAYSVSIMILIYCLRHVALIYAQCLLFLSFGRDRFS